MLVDKATTEYIGADFVSARGITTIRIVDEGEMSTFEQRGVQITKPSFRISYAGQFPTDPYKWTLNNKSLNALIDLFGRETSLWKNRIIEIGVVQGEHPYIMVDTMRTKPAAPAQPAQQPPAAPQPAPAAA